MESRLVAWIDPPSGTVTPSVGLNLFAASDVTGMSLWEVVKAAMPWLSISLAFLAIVAYVPWLSTAMPGYLFGK